MSPTIQLFSDQVEAIYRASWHEDGWSGALAALNSALNASSGTLILRPQHKLEQVIMFSAGLTAIDPEQIENPYRSHFHKLDPFINLPPGEVVTLSEFVDPQVFEDSEFYQQLLRPSNAHYVMGIDLPISEQLLASFRWVRGREALDFDAADKIFLKQLAPHLVQAVDIYRQLVEERTHKSLFANTMNRLAVASFIVGADRQILDTNTDAEQLLAVDNSILNREGRLYLSASTTDRRLKAIISQVGGEESSGLAQTLSINRDGGRPPLALVAKPIASDPNYAGQARLAIFISDPLLQATPSPASLGELFTMTPAESRLALALANGASLEAASTELGISKNTGRAHLRAIFSKTGVNQQSQLVSLILKSVASLS